MVLVLEIIALIILEVTLNPYTRSFVVYDATISYSYQVNSTIPYFVAVCVPLVSLLLSFVAFEVFFTKYTNVGNKSWATNPGVPVSIIWFLDFVGSGVVTSILTEVSKNLVGRYRPDWLSRCQPNIDNPPYIEGFGLNASMNPVCTRDLTQDKVSDGKKSFPSGHSSTAFSLGVFVVGYCIWQLNTRWKSVFHSTQNRDEAQSQRNTRSLIYSLGQSVVFLWILLQISWAWAVALSRVMDNKHHVSDICSGAFLGACIGIVFVFKSIQHATDSLSTIMKHHASCSGDPLDDDPTTSFELRDSSLLSS